jgi:hypothetical protein
MGKFPRPWAPSLHKIKSLTGGEEPGRARFLPSLQNLLVRGLLLHRSVFRVMAGASDSRKWHVASTIHHQAYFTSGGSWLGAALPCPLAAKKPTHAPLKSPPDSGRLRDALGVRATADQDSGERPSTANTRRLVAMIAGIEAVIRYHLSEWSS